MTKTSRFSSLFRIIILTAAFCIIGGSVSLADALPDVYMENPGPGASGWMGDPAGNWKYLVRGIPQRGWQQIGSHMYYFDVGGIMLKGWQDIDGKRYYFAETTSGAYPMGSMYVGGQTPDGGWVDGSGVKTEKGNPYGHTCVEIDLTNQCIYVYQGMNLVLSGPCVSGYRGVHDTATGNFSIRYKETNTYLKGPTWNAYVNYWMPFHGGQGLHDAGWRGTSHENFGGQIYATSGSHGCVNLPLDVAERLYAIAYVGMPVHVHY